MKNNVKVGDRVKIINCSSDSHNSVHEGKIGTVIAFTNSTGSVLVDLRDYGTCTAHSVRLLPTKVVKPSALTLVDFESSLVVIATKAIMKNLEHSISRAKKKGAK